MVSVPSAMLLAIVFVIGFLAGSVCMAFFDDNLRKKRGEK